MTAAPLESALYTGTVRHQRLAPTPHAFDYTLGLFYLDLDELSEVARRLPFFSVERPNLLSFRRVDYLGDPRVPLKQAVLARVQETLGHTPAGPVRMLTHPRYLGYCFNPVTFYYCFEADGTTLDTIVAEITNTPWKERHAYVLRARDAERAGQEGLSFAFDKVFHVSPFLPMELGYVWRFTPPGERLDVHMDALRAGEKVFEATLLTEREPLTVGTVLRALLRLPPMTLKVVAGIHYEALRVYLKRNPFYEHPEIPEGHPVSSSTHTATTHVELATPRNASVVRFLRGRLLARLGAMRHGELVIRDAFGVMRLGAPSPDGLHAEVTVADTEAFYFAAASQGSVGVCGSYGDGTWRCDDLVALVRLFVRNTDVLDGVEQSGLARLGGALLDRYHAQNRNTRAGSRKNIAAHYDLGNDLFRLFLDDSMMYSSALFTEADDTLERAQARRLDRICVKLDLRPSDHLVEIGTGWGGMAIHAAKHYGCRVTTTTISQAQRELALERIAAAGVADKVTVLFEDYRDLRGTYDKLVSLEMIEAVGAEYLDTYFAKVSSLLEPTGLALVQAITIEDSRYEAARRSVDFIKRYIFPGCFIPSVSVMTSAMARTTDLRMTSLEDLGPSYARTLNEWRQRFVAHEPEVRALGYDERFLRLWTLYLAYCEGGFEERRLSNVQLLFAKPGNRRAQFLPELHTEVTP